MGEVILSQAEEQELVQYEVIFENSMRTAATALLAIRDKRLYRKTHATFADYCRDRWGMGKSRAYQLIDSGQVFENLSTMVDMLTGDEMSTIVDTPSGNNRTPFPLPSNEAQARPLARLSPEDQVAAWQQAVETAPEGRVTAAHVALVVKDLEAAAAPSSRMNAGLFSSVTTEWYTPRHIVELVLRMFGTIDLDPCSNSHESPVIPAKKHYTREDDGLVQPWSGCVYMNPPYGDEIGAWVRRMVDAYVSMEIDAGIALLPARTDTEWFRYLSQTDDSILCLVKGRLKFGDAEGCAPFPSALVYLGDDYRSFGTIFSAIGDIWCRIVDYKQEF